MAAFRFGAAFFAAGLRLATFLAFFLAAIVVWKLHGKSFIVKNNFIVLLTIDFEIREIQIVYVNLFFLKRVFANVSRDYACTLTGIPTFAKS